MIKVKLYKDLDKYSELKIYNEDYFPLAYNFARAWIDVDKKSNSFKIEGKQKKIKPVNQDMLKKRN